MASMQGASISHFLAHAHSIIVPNDAFVVFLHQGILMPKAFLVIRFVPNDAFFVFLHKGIVVSNVFVVIHIVLKDALVAFI